MQATSSEILINARKVERHRKYGDTFEFILNEELRVLECVKIESLVRGIIRPIQDIQETLLGCLFELNHVRVNPRLDNSFMIETLTKALNEIGVNVDQRPQTNDMAVCFKPLGEISDSVRFYLHKDGRLVFLSPSLRPRIINNDSNSSSSSRSPRLH